MTRALPTLRVSDADREAAVAELREHCADGRITGDELEDRIQVALAARTRADLHEALLDLPAYVPPTERALLHAIAIEAARGWRLEARFEDRAVLVRPKQPNHVLHGVLTFFTGGLWGFVWLALVIRPGEERAVLRPDKRGRVRARLV